MKYLTVFKEDASKAGVEVNIKNIEWNSFIKLLDERNFEAVRPPGEEEVLIGILSRFGIRTPSRERVLTLLVTPTLKSTSLSILLENYLIRKRE